MAYDFNKIAESYDRLNHIMTAGMDRNWRKRAVRQLSTHNPQLSTLDVACGTGDMTIELLKRSCSVTVVDLSEEMLGIAKRKTEAAGFQVSDFKFQVADAEALPFDDAKFDAVTCAFGIRNFVHLDKGLQEMARVLKPGCRMVILELSTPDSRLIRPFYNIYTKHFIPWLGSRIAGNREAYTYLPESIERFPKGDVMLRILKRHGFKATQKKIFFGVARLYICDKE